MSKIIAVWGATDSGKTTLAINLASQLNKKYNAMVAVVCADDTTPALPLIFPNAKSEDMLSIGAVLSTPDITESEILRNIVTVKGRKNLGFLAFKDGENRFSYPKLDKTKIETFFAVLKGIVDVVIIDCTHNIDNPITAVSFKVADDVIRVVNPDIKNVSFFSSQLPLMTDPQYKTASHIICLNSTDNAVCEPITQATAYFSDVAFTFPYQAELKSQFMKGTVLEKINDKNYNSVLTALGEKVVE